MTALGHLGISEAARLLHSGALSAVELTEMTLRRIEMTEPIVHAYTCVMSERALETARRLDNTPWRGPLHGIPIGVKDLFCTEDAPTEAGSRILAGFVCRHDAGAVRRLRDAGAVVIGKQVMHEFAAGQNVPPTRNPWNLEYYPGGSTAGGGVSVAIGSSLGALGTDTGGSVRKPASVTGTVGLKPAYGRVSLHGTIRAASAPSLDHVGTLTRTVKDAALLLQAISGRDTDDEHSVDAVVPDYARDLEAGIKDCRLGVAPGYFAGPLLDPDVGAAVEEAFYMLQRLGAKLVPIELPSLKLAVPAATTILLAEMAIAHREWIAERPYEYGQGTRVMLELGALLPCAQIERANRARALIRAEVAETFRRERLDALVTPTLPCASMRLCEMRPAVDTASMIPYTFPWNLTGQPAMSVPCGFTSPGLPIGLQIVGRLLDEQTVLRIGRAYERETAWHEMFAHMGAARFDGVSD